MAETGTVVVVESEGNGRMCLTLPEVLITVMGIEKLVPTWRDLEVFLQLLPRSSTAERMNPYTSMWTGRHARATGRRSSTSSCSTTAAPTCCPTRVGRQALRCIRCSACLNVCPVYERTGGRAYGSVYPGPIGAILTPQLRGIAKHPVDKQTASLPFASSLCGACFEVCPVRIDIPEVLVHLRGTGRPPVRGHASAADRRRRAAMRRRGLDVPVVRAGSGWPSGRPGSAVGCSGGAGRIRRMPGPGPDRRLVPGARPQGARRASRSGPGGAGPAAGRGE